mgnify:CR=1 FL=1
MTLTDIIEKFRRDNSEITERVADDTVVKDWAYDADKEFCAITRCIVGDTTFNSVASTSVYNTKYDLAALVDKFYDIDDYPGGGVSFDDDPLDKVTVAQLDADDEDWRTASAGTPEKYYRRGKYLYFDCPVKTASLEIRVYAVLISDDFTGINQTPYNGLTYLEPFHSGISKYLAWMGKGKIGKPGEAQAKRQEFLEYATWAKKQMGGNKYGKITFQKSEAYS